MISKLTNKMTVEHKVMVATNQSYSETAVSLILYFDKYVSAKLKYTNALTNCTIEELTSKLIKLGTAK